MKNKGQLAFESLLVLLIVITSATLILSLYLQFNDETLAIGYARVGALEELSKQKENIIIEKITLQRNPPLITINLNKTTNIDINTTKIENTIKDNTGLKSIHVDVNFIRQ